MLSQLDLQPICKGHSRNQDNDLGNKILATPKKKWGRGSISNWFDAVTNSSKTYPNLQGVG